MYTQLLSKLEYLAGHLCSAAAENFATWQDEKGE